VSDVSEEISGPLNDITSEASMLMEDYIGDEGLRNRLQQIVENVGKIRQSLRDVASGPKTILGAPASTQTDPQLDGKRVLVADDEPNIRQTIADLLKRQGCQVETAKDGAEAIGLLASR